MANTDIVKQRNIKYLNRDFESLKRDLIEHLEVYFPDTVKDFNESSVGMMLLEMLAFTGDNLSFYLDKRFQETFIDSARERKNLLKHARQLGFKPFGKSAAAGTVDGFLKVPISSSANQEIVPDMRYAGTIERGAKLKADNGKTYETLLDADFSEVDTSNSNLVAVGDRDPQTNQPTSFVLKLEDIEIKAGETKSTTFTTTSYAAFKKFTIADDDVLEILSITDSEGNEWFEVDFLAQDTVFDGTANTGADSSDVPFVLKLRSVPYRFVSEFDVETGKTSIIFGTGDAQNFDGDLVPDLGDLALPLYGKDSFTDFFLDPQNFLKTRTLGLSPVNTTLTVTYRVGGGENTNAGANTISTVAESSFDIGDTTLDSNVVSGVGNSFSVLNQRPVIGGLDEVNIDELRQLISANFATQSRTVTAQDFVARTLSMPAKFGRIFRANAKASQINKNAVEIISLSKDSNGHVTVPPSDLKNNLKTYLSAFRMLTDAIEILDGEIINIALNFSVLTNPDFNKTEVLTNAIAALKEFFEIDKWQINQPINITSIYKILGSIPGVLSIIDIQVFNRVGTFDGRSYSTTVHNISENSKNGIIYGKENAIMEVKFLNKDVTGTAR